MVLLSQDSHNLQAGIVSVFGTLGSSSNRLTIGCGCSNCTCGRFWCRAEKTSDAPGGMIQKQLCGGYTATLSPEPESELEFELESELESEPDRYLL